MTVKSLAYDVRCLFSMALPQDMGFSADGVRETTSKDRSRPQSNTVPMAFTLLVASTPYLAPVLLLFTSLIIVLLIGSVLIYSYARESAEFVFGEGGRRWKEEFRLKYGCVPRSLLSPAVVRRS